MCCKRGFLAKLGYSGVTSPEVEEELPPSAFNFPEQFLSSHPEVLMSSSSWKSSLSLSLAQHHVPSLLGMWLLAQRSARENCHGVLSLILLDSFIFFSFWL